MTIKFIVPVNVQVRDFDGQATTKITITRSSVDEWCSGLGSLGDGTASVLQLRQGAPHTKPSYSIQLAGKPSGPALLNPGLLETIIEMTATQLSYVGSFLREYQRDGVASVDHVDIEAAVRGRPEKEAYITFSVPNADMPMSPDEAARWFRA